MQSAGQTPAWRMSHTFFPLAGCTSSNSHQLAPIPCYPVPSPHPHAHLAVDSTPSGPCPTSCLHLPVATYGPSPCAQPVKFLSRMPVATSELDDPHHELLQ